MPPTSLRSTRETHTTTYQRVAPQAREERPEPKEWTYICVTTVQATEDDPGAVEEGKYAVAGDEVVVADLDGRRIGSRQLRPDDAPAAIARQLLRARAPKRSVLVFPNIGVA